MSGFPLGISTGWSWMADLFLETSMENFGNLQQQGLLFSLDFEANEVWKGDNWTSFWWLSHHEKFPELEEYFLRYRHGLCDAGRYSGTRTIFWSRYKKFPTLNVKLWMSWWVISAYYWLIQHLLHLWHWRYEEVHTGSELLYVCEMGWMTCRKGVWKFVTLAGWA